MQVLFSSGQRDLGPGAAPHLEHLGRQVLQVHPLAGQVQVVLTGDAEIRQLNAAFREVDRATDVLSFSYGDQPPPPDGEETVLGEVYVSLDRAAIQAAEQDVPVLEEVGRLMVHGLLHLAGHEHDTEAELEDMERETEAMLALGQVGPSADAGAASGRTSPST